MKDYILIRDIDDVYIALKDFKTNDKVEDFKVLEDIKKGHKIARRDMKKGHLLIKYGVVIGELTEDVKQGQWIHSHNLKTHLSGIDLDYSYNKKEYPIAKKVDKTFLGYLRKNNQAGVRNDLYLLPTVGCVNNILDKIRDEFVLKHKEMENRVKLLTHPFGCSQLGDDLNNTIVLLQGIAHNPNCGGLLVMGLGCENNRLSSFMEGLKDIEEDRIRYFNAQDVNDEIEYALQMLEELYSVMKEDKRTPLPLSYLTLGVKCGGSDGFSGLTANPLVGLISDTIGANNGKVLLTEVPEMFGAEQDLMNRAKDYETFTKIVSLINNFKEYYARNNQPCYENPSPGNKDGGITTLEEKSNGCVLKGGTLEINDVLNYGDRVKYNGLSLVNGPGNDLMACTNLVASGATLILFTTGRGTPFSALVPTVKIATNHSLYEKKSNWIDFDSMMAFDQGFEKTSEELLSLIIDIASGKEVKNEFSKNGLISLFKTGVTL